MKKQIFWLLVLLLPLALLVYSINRNNSKQLTVFHINDPHSRLDNFDKIKYIVDKESESNEVLLLCGGDIFTGDPIVDLYPERGYPIIDIMNDVGFDVSVIGNHEFDYGDSTLVKRMNEAKFQWVAANVDISNVTQQEILKAFTTIEKGGYSITFLGLLETSKKDYKERDIPSTHPLRIENIEFQNPNRVAKRYKDLKENTNADLLIGLTHLGYDMPNDLYDDYKLAEEDISLDLIVGGHTQVLVDTIVNNIPIYQAGAFLEYLGKVKIETNWLGKTTITNEYIDLNKYHKYDEVVKQKIEAVKKEMAFLEEEIGFSNQDYSKDVMACFLAEAIRIETSSDYSIVMGAREGLDKGAIIYRDLYKVAPFGNQVYTYNITIADLKELLKSQHIGYSSGLGLTENGEFKNILGNLIPDSKQIQLAVQDYLVVRRYDSFSKFAPNKLKLTDSEAIIKHLRKADTIGLESNCKLKINDL